MINPCVAANAMSFAQQYARCTKPRGGPRYVQRVDRPTESRGATCTRLFRPSRPFPPIPHFPSAARARTVEGADVLLVDVRAPRKVLGYRQRGKGLGVTRSASAMASAARSHSRWFALSLAWQDARYRVPFDRKVEWRPIRFRLLIRTYDAPPSPRGARAHGLG